MIICIGEIVWDIFGSNSVLGGAPLNVAYHLKDLGQDVRIISRIGDDQYGLEAINKISDLGLSVEDIQKDNEHSTGKVLISIGDNHEPAFDIMEPAAWDFIENIALENSSQPLIVVCGTLAQRSKVSRRTIRAFSKKADLLCYDVNLRPPHTKKDFVVKTLGDADIVKLNDNELYEIAKWHDWRSPDLEKLCQSLFKKYNLKALAVTLGGSGAVLYCEDGFFKHEGFPVQVVDTVGAGDAFFAALIDGIVNKLSWQECLTRANHRGSYVASQAGATPSSNPF